MLGTRYTFIFTDPVLGVPRIEARHCLTDAMARQEMWRLPGVIRITEAGRQVWPRPERALHAAGDDCA